MSRTFTDFAERTPEIKALLNQLIRLQGDQAGYRGAMRQLGAFLADYLIPKLNGQHTKDICVVCTVEDADFIARGLIGRLETSGFGDRVHLVCMWNDRIEKGGVSVSPVLRTYEESFDKDDVTFIIVKSIISGACVVRTNLTKVLTCARPQRVFIASPVMLYGAENRLAREFSPDVSSKFEFLHFATDTEKSPDGTEVVPGIGGSVYQLLGVGTAKTKNKYVPEIVKERRSRIFPQLSEAQPVSASRPGWC